MINKLHVKWIRGVIDIHDGWGHINVVFQSMHSNRITAGLEMFGPFRVLH
jgi:hypothetical protein